MHYFHNDYSEGCHPQLLKLLQDTNYEQTVGYGEDPYCQLAAQAIAKRCGDQKVSVHFLVGGTQANLTVIAAALRAHHAVLCAASAHINVHETGAVEATGHKVLALPTDDGKITAAQIQAFLEQRIQAGALEHTALPKMVYLSQPTEYGTIYSRAELEAISDTAKRWNMMLFVDGARMGYGMASDCNDVSYADLARLCDVFYIGGTKVGALFGEAVVISNPAISEDFRYLIKQRGGMLAKGRLLGLQFWGLFRDGLYESISVHAVGLANQIRVALKEAGIGVLVDSPTNQIFPIFDDVMLARLEEKYLFTFMEKVDETHTCIRICTSWATRPEAVRELCDDIRHFVTE